VTLTSKRIARVCQSKPLVDVHKSMTNWLNTAFPRFIEFPDLTVGLLRFIHSFRSICRARAT